MVMRCSGVGRCAKSCQKAQDQNWTHRGFSVLNDCCCLPIHRAFLRFKPNGPRGKPPWFTKKGAENDGPPDWRGACDTDDDSQHAEPGRSKLDISQGNNGSECGAVTETARLPSAGRTIASTAPTAGR
jgi:hypothetical protein